VEAEAGSGSSGSDPFSVEVEARKFYRFRFHRLFDLKSNLVKNFCPFANVDLNGEVALQVWMNVRYQ